MDLKNLRYDAEMILKERSAVDEFKYSAAKFIIEKTDPLTIKESGWNEKEHHLAGATNRVGEDVVMLRDRDFGSSGGYLIACVDGDYNPDALTPNGKKYEVREVTSDLSTEQIDELPVGSVVAAPGCRPFVKITSESWMSSTQVLTSSLLADYENVTLLRYGWGDEEED